jgi:hypothetical protein
MKNKWVYDPIIGSPVRCSTNRGCVPGVLAAGVHVHGVFPFFYIKVGSEHCEFAAKKA